MLSLAAADTHLTSGPRPRQAVGRCDLRPGGSGASSEGADFRHSLTSSFGTALSFLQAWKGPISIVWPRVFAYGH